MTSLFLKKVYKSCPILLSNKFTLVDLVELDMLDFDGIFGMDWLHACFASIDYTTRVVKFQFSNEPILARKGANLILRGQIISCLKSCIIVSKGCLYHIMRVKDLGSKDPLLESVPIVKDFLDVFPNDLIRIPSEQEIYFSIDVLPNT